MQNPMKAMAKPINAMDKQTVKTMENGESQREIDEDHGKTNEQCK